MSDSRNAVFLSYASQDAEAAKRICESLRSVGVEVWFDQSELVGGDAWDHKIRSQIRDCALLVPVISKATQARREAYFRLKWRLADERTHLMAKGTPFLLPVAIDETSDRDALVPDSFLAVQWTKAPQGEIPPAFAARVRNLLGGERGGVNDLARGRGEGLESATAASARHPKWLWPVLTLAIVGVGLLGYRMINPRSRGAVAAPATAVVATGSEAEAQRLVDRA